MGDMTRTISREQVRVAFAVEDEFLVALERDEIVVCESDGCYSPVMVERIRVCRNLHHELGVNLAGLEVALRLLETIRAERSQFREVLEWLKRELESNRR